MNEVKGIEKSMTVGEGRMSYKGVPDQEVKKIIGSAMAKNGLAIVPIKVEPSIKIERWEETDNYGKLKPKQSVFTDVKVTYLLMHESGESQEICGYGQGVDSQDKGAGKATTYALKYALLYTFLIPTGNIDDSDNYHSEAIETPKAQSKNALSWVDAINRCTNNDELMALYNANKDKITSEVKELFTKRKLEL